MLALDHNLFRDLALKRHISKVTIRIIRKEEEGLKGKELAELLASWATQVNSISYKHFVVICRGLDSTIRSFPESNHISIETNVYNLLRHLVDCT